MATKSVTTKLTAEEIKYQHRVKSVELAIKATVGKNGSMIDYILKSADKIYKYLSE